MVLTELLRASEHSTIKGSQLKTTVTPFLMFEGCAEEAMTFYVGLFADGQVLNVARYGKDGPGREGSIQLALFEIAGQRIMCMDSPASHAFTFTPSVSLFVDCSSDEQIDGLYAALSKDGTALMPVGAYGFSQKFGWVQDRYGVSWQLNLPHG